MALTNRRAPTDRHTRAISDERIQRKSLWIRVSAKCLVKLNIILCRIVLTGQPNGTPNSLS
uniref:Uncharacterized protein n=1 Tax=Anguilla anguilla TaxID=7936 RepID=A0A0E9QED2_ANGAN